MYFLFVIFSAHILFGYNQMLDIIELNTDVSYSLEMHSDASCFVDNKIFIYQQNPNFWKSSQAKPNTFVWYLWREFTHAEGLEKLNICEKLNNISN